MKDAHTILLAAALTYVAGSLASLLNVWRWLRYFRH
jgi:Zn-dependent membrane protease YugP